MNRTNGSGSIISRVRRWSIRCIGRFSPFRWACSLVWSSTSRRRSTLVNSHQSHKRTKKKLVRSFSVISSFWKSWKLSTVCSITNSPYRNSPISSMDIVRLRQMFTYLPIWQPFRTCPPHSPTSSRTTRSSKTTTREWCGCISLPWTLTLRAATICSYRREDWRSSCRTKRIASLLGKHRVPVE